jgi:ribulose-phosphate 3-epimerase
MTDIIPGIFEENIADVEKKIKMVAPFVEAIQIDFGDGEFIDKKTPLEGSLYKNIINLYPNIIFEAHLMVSKPENFIQPLSRVGFKRIIGHVESFDPRFFLEESKYESIEVGMALDCYSEFEIIEPFLEHLDFILIMTAQSGKSGQSFQPETLEKVKLIHMNFPDLPIEVDCGINNQTARVVCDAGATRLVSTSYIFKNPEDIESAIETLKKVCLIDIEPD